MRAVADIRAPGNPAARRCVETVPDPAATRGPMVTESISLQTLIDQDTPPSPPTVTTADLPDLHEQLIALAARGKHLIDAARLLARLHDMLIDFPGADPRAASRVVHEIVLALRRGVLEPTDEWGRFDVAQGWVDNLYMRSRQWMSEQDRARG
jgi:hypothetical protein